MAAGDINDPLTNIPWVTVQDRSADPADAGAGFAPLYVKNGILMWLPHGGTPQSPLSNPMTTQDDLIVGGAAGAPARLAKGADSQVLTVDPTTHHLSWATPAAGGSVAYNGQLFLPAWGYSSIGAGTWGNYALFEGGLNSLYNTSGANGDELLYPVALGAGTYTLAVAHRASGNSGIAQFLLDATSLGTQDWYSAATLDDQITTIAGIVVAANGLFHLHMKVNGKNAGSSGYFLLFGWIMLYRTA